MRHTPIHNVRLCDCFFLNPLSHLSLRMFLIFCLRQKQQVFLWRGALKFHIKLIKEHLRWRTFILKWWNKRPVITKIYPSKYFIWCQTSENLFHKGSFKKNVTETEHQISNVIPYFGHFIGGGGLNVNYIHYILFEWSHMKTSNCCFCKRKCESEPCVSY